MICVYEFDWNFFGILIFHLYTQGKKLIQLYHFDWNIWNTPSFADMEIDILC